MSDDTKVLSQDERVKRFKEGKDFDFICLVECLEDMVKRYRMTYQDVQDAAFVVKARMLERDPNYIKEQIERVSKGRF